MSPKILLEKNKERKNRKSEEKERKKKVMAALLVFMFTSLEIVFERENCWRGELYFGCNFL